MSSNKLYCFHLDGQLLDHDVWTNYSKNYGSSGLHGWRPPKRVYYKIGHARNGKRHLPKEIQDKVKIVEYVPGKEIE